IREVIANEESVVRRRDAFVEDGEGGFELRRTRGEPEQRALLGIFHERTFTILKGQLSRLLRQSFEGGRSDDRSNARAARAMQKRPPIQMSRFPVHVRNASAWFKARKERCVGTKLLCAVTTRFP